QRKSIAADEEFDRVSQRRRPEVLDLLPFDEPHFHEADRHSVIPRDIRDTRPFPGLERVERSHGRATSTMTTASSSPRKLRRWWSKATMHGWPGCTIRTRTPARRPISSSRRTRCVSPSMSRTDPVSPGCSRCIGIMCIGFQPVGGAIDIEIESQYALFYQRFPALKGPIWEFRMKEILFWSSGVAAQSAVQFLAAASESYERRASVALCIRLNLRHTRIKSAELARLRQLPRLELEL